MPALLQDGLDPAQPFMPALNPDPLFGGLDLAASEAAPQAAEDASSLGLFQGLSGPPKPLQEASPPSAPREMERTAGFDPAAVLMVRAGAFFFMVLCPVFSLLFVSIV